MGHDHDNNGDGLYKARLEMDLGGGAWICLKFFGKYFRDV